MNIQGYDNWKLEEPTTILSEDERHDLVNELEELNGTIQELKEEEDEDLEPLLMEYQNRVEEIKLELA